MKSGWHCFDDTSSDEENAITSVPVTEISIGRLVAELFRAYPSRPRAHGVPNLVLPPVARFLHLEPALSRRLVDAGWTVLMDDTTICLHPDVIVALDAFPTDKALDDDSIPETLRRLHDGLLPGGLLLTRIPDGLSVEFTSELWAMPRTTSNDPLVPSFSLSASRHIRHACFVVVHRRAGVANPLPYRLTPATAAALDIERNWIDTVTIARSASERRYGVLSVENHRRACMILETYGLVILRNLYHADTVRSWASAAQKDFAAVADKLKQHYDMDVFNPGEKPPRRNFVEFATREAYRCDLRHTPALKAMRSTYSHQEMNAHDDNDIMHTPWNHLNFNPRHPVIVRILQEVMQPDGDEEQNAGNYGLWNFDFGGPGSRQDLIHGDVGAIISTPGCQNQTIHADIPHLFNTVDVPPHLVHGFLPACDDGGFAAGQTAFVVTSHKLRQCARFTRENATRETVDHILERMDHTIRPHLQCGDYIAFDCRILHLGLANTTAPAGSVEDGTRRVVLYVNWHMPWFEDKKNWEPESLFGAEIEERT